jgi:hypothetical protein
MLLLLLAAAAVLGYGLYKFTVYAPPCFAGFAAGQFAYSTGAGGLGSAIVGLGAALAAFASLRWLYFNATAPIRYLVALAVTLSTAAVAYFLFDDLSSGGVPSEIWRQLLCLSGACVMGLVAFSRLANPAPDGSD